MENKKHQPKAAEGFHEILLYTTPNAALITKQMQKLPKPFLPQFKEEK